MPLLDPSQLRGTVFLYPSRAAALNHDRIGGTGFFVGRKNRLVENNWVPYLVSNTHVINGGASVARFNRQDGSTAIIELHPSDWIPHPTADVAAVCIMGVGDWRAEDVTYSPEEDFITPAKIEQWRIGVGDEVFMVGRFLNHQGKNLIRPAARFGSISMMQEDIWNSALGHEEESIAVEMRSRTGFSGSPVKVYRNGATNISMFHPVDWLYGLLGVNWGYIYDKDTKENSWLNGVVPAWKISEVLDSPVLAKKQQAVETLSLMQGKR